MRDKVALTRNKVTIAGLYDIAGSRFVINKDAFTRNKIAIEILKTKLGDSNEYQSHNCEI